MRKTCDGCPCLERKSNLPFCFWYQGFVFALDGCGNEFTEKPEKTQVQCEADMIKQLDEELSCDSHDPCSIKHDD